MEFGSIAAPGERFCFRAICLENRYTRKGIVGSNPFASKTGNRGKGFESLPACSSSST